MRRNLVLARAGRGSLHDGWLDAARPRNWDLVLVPYEEIDTPSGDGIDATPVVRGAKWTGLRHVLAEWDGWRQYDQVWMPDDDIAADQDTINRMFDLGSALRLDLFAPALHPASYFAHFITMQNPRFTARLVGFVEIMMPAFSGAALERLAPTLAMSETGWGWGLDSLWPKQLGYRNIGILDATPVVHTRPVGRMRDAELERRVLAESDAILSAHGCRQMHRTYAACGDDLQPLALTGDALLTELIRGWEYLIEADPRILSWIGEYQRSGAGCPTYPVAGTPCEHPPAALVTA